MSMKDGEAEELQVVAIPLDELLGKIKQSVRDLAGPTTIEEYVETMEAGDEDNWASWAAIQSQTPLRARFADDGVFLNVAGPGILTDGAVMKGSGQYAVIGVIDGVKGKNLSVYLDESGLRLLANHCLEAADHLQKR